MKYSLPILKSKNIFKRLNYPFQMHWASIIFGYSATIIEGFGYHWTI